MTSEFKIVKHQSPSYQCGCGGTINEYTEENELIVRRWFYQCDACKRYSEFEEIKKSTRNKC